MGKISASIEIEAPRERVWEVLLDPSRLGEWVTIHERVRSAPDGLLEEGSRFEQTVSVSGKSFDVTWTVERLDEPSLAEWKAEGPAGSSARATYRLLDRD